MTTMIDALALFAASWGVLMAVSPLLQVRRILQRRSSADVSLSYLFVLQVGFVTWLAYGYALGNLALIVPNFAALTVGTVTMIATWRYRSGSRASA
jgi:MtN3 and saliva related transmembrane protein